MTAAAASRDVTLFHAMALLHRADYDIGQVQIFAKFSTATTLYVLT